MGREASYVGQNAEGNGEDTMTWIRTEQPGASTPDLNAALKEVMGNCPDEYRPERRGERRVPPIVMRDSIVLVHSLVPAAMKHMFAAFGAMTDPSLPLSRRQHEMIAATVSSLNRCFY